MKEYHFYAASCLNWTTDQDMDKCITRQKKADMHGRYHARSCVVYRVPLPETADYEIDNYLPVVDNIEFIGRVVY